MTINILACLLLALIFVYCCKEYIEAYKKKLSNDQIGLTSGWIYSGALAFFIGVLVGFALYGLGVSQLLARQIAMLSFVLFFVVLYKLLEWNSKHK